MKRLFTLFAILSVTMPAMAVTSPGRGRLSMSNQMRGRMATSKANDTDVAAKDKTAQDVPAQEDTQTDSETVKDMREREKAACMQNNIGMGATFVWASRFSDTSNYNLMVEDVQNPENNVCFVKVDIKSADPRIRVLDIQPRWFAMGDTITCGQWVDKEDLRQRILDAKKSGRTWATIGGAVGGAGIGVGAMELFGNKLIGGAVEGQADMGDTERLCSQLKDLKDDDKDKYDKIRDQLGKLKEYCGEDNKLDGCEKYEYEELLKC